MKFIIDDHFKAVCRTILEENKSLDEWAEIESDDMFQHGNIVGGFDSTEGEFCFSVYLDDEEYWFQIPLADLPLVLSEDVTEIEAYRANSD